MRAEAHWRRAWRVGVVIAIGAMVVFVAGCGGGSGSAGTSASSGQAGSAPSEPEANTTASGDESGKPDISGVTEKQLEKTLELSFNGPIPANKLDPIAEEAFKIASLPLTPELEEKLLECMSQPVCETGHGDKTIGIAEEFSSEVPHAVVERAEMTLQALRYPSVKKIIFTEANGEVTKLLSNFRSLISQGANVILGVWPSGAAVLPVAREAAAKGIAVVAVSEEITQAVQGRDLASRVVNPLCETGEEQAELAIKTAGGGSSGTVQLMTGPPGNAYGAVWMPCAEKVLQEEGWSWKTSNTNWTPQGEQQAVSSLIALPNPPDAIIYDYAGEAIVQDYVSEHSEPPPLIMGGGTYGYINAANEAREKYPNLKAYTTTSLYYHSFISLTVGMDAAEGEQVPEKIVVPDPTQPVDAPAIKAQYSPEIPTAVSPGSLLPPPILAKLFES